MDVDYLLDRNVPLAMRNLKAYKKKEAKRLKELQKKKKMEAQANEEGHDLIIATTSTTNNAASTRISPFILSFQASPSPANHIRSFSRESMLPEHERTSSKDASVEQSLQEPAQPSVKPEKHHKKKRKRQTFPKIHIELETPTIEEQHIEKLFETGHPPEENELENLEETDDVIYRGIKKKPDQIHVMSIEESNEYLMEQEKQREAAISMSRRQKVADRIFSKEKKEKWRIRTALTFNPIRSLYYSFEFRWTYFNVFMVMYKIALVGVSVALINFPKVSIPLSLAIHLCVFLVLIISHPYILWGEDLFAIVVLGLTLIDTIFTVIILFVSMGNWIVYVLLGLNTLIPILSVILIIMSIYRGIVSSQHYRNLSKRLAKYCTSPDHDNDPGMQEYRTFLLGEMRRKISKRIKPMANLEHIKEFFDFMRISHRNVDEQLTNKSMRYLIYFFIILGVVTFICLVPCLVGLLFDELNPSYVTYGGSFSENTVTCENWNTIEYLGTNNGTILHKTAVVDHQITMKTLYLKVVIKSLSYGIVEMVDSKNAFDKL
eukprot:CAMPEP_0117419888 /NCGR_PEP_ID=MMETSP0758-20121206/1358_1 /TAXON_ID=63605 /ORGANISM="Percolomonas cosmopolitus, Strain AE-1 (ATCC 50343)" /LENGTH=546 /DNA_ID=CAMNT_0005201219 /DNA_START=1056 /DNA_END=2697 /DNA_ORIENTATION=+